MNSYALEPKRSKINTLSGFGWALVDADTNQDTFNEVKD